MIKNNTQTIHSKILTPNGFVNMGDIKKGDLICDNTNGITPVLDVESKGLKEIYKVYFSDDTYVECGEDHLWYVSTVLSRAKQSKNKDKIINVFDSFKTKDMLNNVLYGSNLKINYALQELLPVHYNKISDRELLIDHYTMGVLLGDGSFVNAISFTTMDKPIVEHITKLTSKYDYKIIDYENQGKKSDALSYYIRNTDRSERNNIFKNEIENLGLLNKKSNSKFIPKEYLYSSVEDRISLLQGLMDTDGYTDGVGTYYYTISEQLKDDVVELVKSLGGLTSVTSKIPTYTHNGEKLKGQLIYNICVALNDTIIPFRLERHKIKYKPKTKYLPKKFITKIEKTGEFCEMVSISIDNENGLYITNDFTITHI